MYATSTILTFDGCVLSAWIQRQDCNLVDLDFWTHCIMVGPEATSEQIHYLKSCKTMWGSSVGRKNTWGKTCSATSFVLISITSTLSSGFVMQDCVIPPKFWHLLFDLSLGLGATKALLQRTGRRLFNQGCFHAELLRRNTWYHEDKLSRFFTPSITCEK